MKRNTPIYSKNHIRKIESNTNSTIHCKLFIKTIEFKLSIRKVIIFTIIPNITSINKNCTVNEFINDIKTILDTSLQKNLASLFNSYCITRISISSRTNCSRSPSSKAISSTNKKPTFKR